MLVTFRNMLIAAILTCLLIMLVAVPAQAQSWSSGLQSGLTSVESVFEDGVYTWTLTNRSSLEGDVYGDFDILVWSLIPFQVQEPIAWEAPAGWTWTGGQWVITASPSRKYYVPDALGPGSSVQFSYTPNPDGQLINAQGPQPDGLGFIAHIAAVVPDSGSWDGTTKWQPVETEFGYTWHDIPETTSIYIPIPEPSGLIAMLVGFATLTSRFIPRTRK